MFKLETNSQVTRTLSLFSASAAKGCVFGFYLKHEISFSEREKTKRKTKPLTKNLFFFFKEKQSTRPNYTNRNKCFRLGKEYLKHLPNKEEEGEPKITNRTDKNKMHKANRHR